MARLHVRLTGLKRLGASVAHCRAFKASACTLACECCNASELLRHKVLSPLHGFCRMASNCTAERYHNKQTKPGMLQ